jgi:2'-5' RNA ligase
MSSTLILTSQLDDIAQSFYEGLRQRYFPPERNLIPAHLTVFHNLPDENHVYDMVREAARAGSLSRGKNPQLRSIGRGVAVYFQIDPLSLLRTQLSSVFQFDLIPQDRQRFDPHIVVQNKVDSETAKRTLAELKALELVEPTVIGFTLWRYLGGPWEHLEDLPFAASISL